MKTRAVKDVFGNEVVYMIPETESDREKIREMDEDGEIDTDHSFSDSPTSLPLEEKQSPRRNGN